MKPLTLSLPLLSLSLITLSLHLLAPTLAQKCHPDDVAGLLGFKALIKEDPSSMLSSWKPNTDCCKWDGITCSSLSSMNRVTALSLYGQEDDPKSFLSGPISFALSKLTYLNGIYLVNLRKITGAFPSLLFKLPNINYVYIENCELHGALPENIGQLFGLEALSFSGNKFSGPIPNSISNLTKLTQLKFGRNSLSGEIPAGIQRLKSLRILNLEHNMLRGPIPDLSGLTELLYLELSHNRLIGKIPATISVHAPLLQFLELGHNLLTGSIPSFLGNFQKLDTLDLSSNYLTGPVPQSFKNLTKIFNLDLSENLLVDPFPAMKVKGIESLKLSHNRFHLGKIPDWVTSSPIIYSLGLAGCGIKMQFEEWKPKDTYFYDYIDLSGNEITGNPAALLNRTEFLVGFNVSSNKLSFDLGKVNWPTTLRDLDMSRNMAKGKIPASFAGLSGLNVSYNHLCGLIPATKFPASSFLGNDCLCGKPLPPCRK
ncbi:hypothetical protein AMTRI_Chr13g84430 [Amborella trichopoda]